MWSRMLAGAAAGTAAAVPMTAYWEYMHQRLDGEPPRPLPPREIVEALAVKAGVSRNQFDQFNVGTKGLILNNSTGNAQTQIGGWISGNLRTMAWHRHLPCFSLSRGFC